MLELSNPDLRALATGEVITAFVGRATLTEGDEVDLAPGGPVDAASLKAAYRRWAELDAPPGRWSAVVIAVHPAVSLDAAAGASRHIRASVPEGDLVLLRVFEDGEPVLSDTAFDARRRSVEGAIIG